MARRKKNNRNPPPKAITKEEVVNIATEAIQAMGNNSYGYGRSGASRTTSSMVGYKTISGGPDRDIVENISLLRERSRDSYMGNPIATGILKKYKTSVVGKGLVPKPSLRANVLGISQEEAQKIELEIKSRFNTWAKSPNSDAMRMHNFYALQSLVVLNWLMNGDVFAIPKFKNREGVSTKLCVQIIEGDRVRDPYVNLDRSIIEGVELDDDGELIAYHVSNKHPGDDLTFKSVRVKAYNQFGKRNILHVFEPERPGQRRGTPLIAPAIESLKQIGRYSQAELMAAVVNSMYAFFVEQLVDQPNSPLPGIYGNVTGANRNFRDATDKFELAKGAVNILRPGETVKDFTPGRPNSNYKSFVDSIYEEIGASVELPKEVMLSNFQSSYSAARAALEEAWQKFYGIREVLINYFCQPIYEMFILEQLSLGNLNLPGYYEDEKKRNEYARATWVGSKKISLDPYKEMKAREIALELGLTNREILSQEDGRDFDELVEQKLREDKMLAASKGEEGGENV
jgi:lambda family phage portal protein